MRPTGIIRRMDDLGRVVIPLSLRQELGFTAGQPIEFYIDYNKHAIVLVDYLATEKEKNDNEKN